MATVGDLFSMLRGIFEVIISFFKSLMPDKGETIEPTTPVE